MGTAYFPIHTKNNHFLQKCATAHCFTAYFFRELIETLLTNTEMLPAFGRSCNLGAGNELIQCHLNILRNRSSWSNSWSTASSFGAVISPAISINALNFILQKNKDQKVWSTYSNRATSDGIDRNTIFICTRTLQWQGSLLRGKKKPHVNFNNQALIWKSELLTYQIPSTASSLRSPPCFL